MLIEDIIAFFVFSFIVLVRSQEVSDGPKVNRPSMERILGNQFGETSDTQILGNQFTKPAIPQYFSCLDLDACRTGLDFCNHKRKSCEKCEDYRLYCGTNQQNINCTQYCVSTLVEEQCLAKMATNPTTTPVTAGGFSGNREVTYSPDCLSKPGHDADWKNPVIGVLGFVVIISVGLNIYLLTRGIKQSKLKELRDEQDPLMGVCSSGPSSQDPILNVQYSSVPLKNDNTGHDSLQPSASVTPPEIRDPKHTKVKEKWRNENCVPSRPDETDTGERKCDSRTSDIDLQHSMDTDNRSSSGYSSSRTSSLGSIPVINNNINITFNGMRDNSSVVPTDTEKVVSNPENASKVYPYSVQETDDNDKSSSSINVVVNERDETKNQKPVSDENSRAKFAVGDMSVDMDDFKKC